MIHSNSLADPDLYCYQLPYYIDYDPESVWALVQQHCGHISVLPAGYYNFYIAREYAVLLLLAFPLLQRKPQQDLYC
jgi:hypothetical protein